MKLENQVCSFKLANKLKELGVKQESLFYWMSYYASPNMKGNTWHVDYPVDYDGKHYPRPSNTEISAFTVAELGEMLPEKIEATIEMLTLYKEMENDTEANARAKMLICLLGEK